MGMEKEQWFGFVLKAGPVGQGNFKNMMIMSGKVQPKDTQQNGQRQNLGSWLQCHTLNNTSTYLRVKGSNFFLSALIVICWGNFRLWKGCWETVWIRHCRSVSLQLSQGQCWASPRCSGGTNDFCELCRKRSLKTWYIGNSFPLPHTLPKRELSSHLCEHLQIYRGVSENRHKKSNHCDPLVEN